MSRRISLGFSCFLLGTAYAHACGGGGSELKATIEGMIPGLSYEVAAAVSGLGNSLAGTVSSTVTGMTVIVVQHLSDPVNVRATQSFLNAISTAIDEATTDSLSVDLSNVSTRGDIGLKGMAQYAEGI